MARIRTLTLTNEARQKLIECRDHDPRPFLRERCAALLKIAEGKSPHWVARNGLLKPRDPDAVYGWLNVYQDNGIAGLIAHQHGGDRKSRRRL